MFRSRRCSFLIRYNMYNVIKVKLCINGSVHNTYLLPQTIKLLRNWLLNTELRLFLYMYLLNIIIIYVCAKAVPNILYSRWEGKSVCGASRCYNIRIFLLADYIIISAREGISSYWIIGTYDDEISVNIPYFLLLSLTLSFPLDEVNCFMEPTNLFSSSSMSS